MNPRSTPDVFIQTLEEMYVHERERKKARLRLQIKAHVKRFVEEFRSDFNHSRQGSDWTLQATRIADDAGRGFRSD